MNLYDENGKKLSKEEVFSRVSLEKCNRVEIIDENGRSYSNWRANNKVEILLQDNFRTLKIFIQNRK